MSAEVIYQMGVSVMKIWGYDFVKMFSLLENYKSTMERYTNTCRKGFQEEEVFQMIDHDSVFVSQL